MANLDCFFHDIFYNIIKVNHFLYCFVILLHLFSSFLLTRSFLVPYAYFSMESTDCIYLSLFELKAIFLISSVNILCLSLLNLHCYCNINLLFLMNSLFIYLFILHYLFQFDFFIDGLFYSHIELLVKSFFNYQV